MMMELKEVGPDVGERRVGRLMKIRRGSLGEWHNSNLQTARQGHLDTETNLSAA